MLVMLTNLSVEGTWEEHGCNHRNTMTLWHGRHNEAAASTAPVPLNVDSLVTTTSTGYFHCMNFAQPQYAHFLPKYFPMYGTTTMVNNNSSCCKLSCHSRSASVGSPSSELCPDEVVVGEDGRESSSEGEDGESSPVRVASMKDDWESEDMVFGGK